MKSIFTTTVMLLLLGISARAQVFYGTAVYESKTTMPPIKADGISDEMARQLEAMARKQMEKTFELHFNPFESAYQEQSKIESPQPQMPGVNIRMVNSGQGRRYTSIKENKSISEEEIFGKEFLISDELPQWNWKLGDETKTIGGYTCRKATAVIPVTDAQRETYQKQQQEKEQNPNRVLIMDEPQDYKVTVWYTPDVAVSHGPSNFWGLPGLILEANDGRTVLLCSKLVLNPRDKPAIKKPKTGEKVTQKQFDEIQRKKMSELQQMQQGRGSDDGVRIRIGG